MRGIRFSRNFGKEAAIFAGLAQARGACCVVLDCDLQHPPEKILEMYRLWQEGWQVVEGIKGQPRPGKSRPHLAARTFYRFLSGATRIDMSRASDFKLLDRRAVDVLIAMREKNAFFRALSSWIGFDTTQVEFEVQPRAALLQVVHPQPHPLCHYQPGLLLYRPPPAGHFAGGAGIFLLPWCWAPTPCGRS